MFKKILIANCGEYVAQAASAKPNCVVRVAHAGKFTAENQNV